MPPEQKCIRLFISYSHCDQELRAELDKHLSPLKRSGIIHVWHDRHIDAGKEWHREIQQNLEEADIILLLISADLIASEYAYSKEMIRALERHDAGEARVIPVILHPCDWEFTHFARIQALPRDAKAVSLWANQAEALADVARGVRIVAQDIATNPLKRPVAPTPEEPEVAPRVRERRADLLEQLEELQREDTTHQRRRDIGQRLAEIGDPREGVGVKDGMPSILWRPIPKGEVEIKGHGVFAVEPFQIAAYPVTFAQFRALLDAKDGSVNERRAGWRSGLSNHPVTDVSWHNATAFCRWLSAPELVNNFETPARIN